jgi:hypothetical protein
MMKEMTIGVAVLGLVVIGSGAQAALILHVDAAAPGGSPTTTWIDHSPSGYDFAASGTVTHNAGNQSYSFSGGSGQLHQAVNNGGD